MKLIHNDYGKARVRMAKVIRRGDQHNYLNMMVNIVLQGDLIKSYTLGENTNVLPTDTMKNTVYALAVQHEFASIEQFGLLLADHFLGRVDHLSAVQIDIEEQRWERVQTAEGPHPHAFMGGFSERGTVQIKKTRETEEMKSGLKDLFLLKTAKSAFTGFFKDELTVLPEETDRIMGTCLTSWWRYANGAGVNYKNDRRQVRDLLISEFADHDSQSVQHTLYRMGTAVLEAIPALSEIYLSMPNVHNIPFDFKRLGIDSHNAVFMPIDEPHGSITGIIRR